MFDVTEFIDIIVAEVNDTASKFTDLKRQIVIDYQIPFFGRIDKVARLHKLVHWES